MHIQERKYFDSGDYALSKAGKASDTGVTQVGREHPVPENIPHSSSPAHNLHNGVPVLSPPGSGLVGGGAPGQNGSPVKEGSFLQRETSVDDVGGEASAESETGSAHAKQGPVPIMQ